MNNTEPVPSIDEVIRALCHRFEDPKQDSFQAQVDAKAQLQRICASERLDEQMSTGTLRYKPDKGGDYGAVYYFTDHSTTITQAQRIEALQTQLEGETMLKEKASE
jgi:hypothetical protein